jgi:hypothetical protein
MSDNIVISCLRRRMQAAQAARVFECTLTQEEPVVQMMMRQSSLKLRHATIAVRGSLERQPNWLCGIGLASIWWTGGECMRHRVFWV